MNTIVEKQDVLSYDDEETNNVQLEEATYLHMNLTKLENLNVVPSKKIKRKLDKIIW